MTLGTDRDYLLTDQYRNASKLEARIELHRRFSTNQYGWHRWVFDRLGLPPDARILELGCGPGTLWRENADRIPAGWDVTLSDFSPGMLEEAQRNLAALPVHFRFEVVDAQSIPFADARFDAVIANHMLYHVLDRAKALGEIARVLARTGRLYAATNGSGHMQALDELARGCLPSLSSRIRMPSLAFRLDNGATELAPLFSHVSLHHYSDALVITDAAPLVRYILSMGAASLLAPQMIEQLTQCVEQALADHGVIRVAKETGLFEAWNDDRDRG